MCTNFCRFPGGLGDPHRILVEEQHELVLANVKQEYIDFCSEGKLFSQWQAQNPGQTLNEFTVMQFKVFVVEKICNLLFLKGIQKLRFKMHLMIQSPITILFSFNMTNSFYYHRFCNVA